jgi:hypothetical protein
MTEQEETWPDLLEKALFEKDPALRRQRIRAAEKGILDRLQELNPEKQMLEDARKKLKACR